MPTVTATAKRSFGFLHLAVNFEGTDGAAERAVIEQALNKAKDWLRYGPDCWLIYTSRSPKSWSEDLMGLAGMKQHTFFICEVNIKNRSGWLQRSAWDWINKTRD